MSNEYGTTLERYQEQLDEVVQAAKQGALGFVEAEDRASGELTPVLVVMHDTGVKPIGTLVDNEVAFERFAPPRGAYERGPGAGEVNPEDADRTVEPGEPDRMQVVVCDSIG